MRKNLSGLRPLKMFFKHRLKTLIMCSLISFLYVVDE